MDPNATLEEMRMLSALVMDDSVDISEIDVETLAELVISMDEWLSKGGFLPARWDRNRRK